MTYGERAGCHLLVMLGIGTALWYAMLLERGSANTHWTQWVLPVVPLGIVLLARAAVGRLAAALARRFYQWNRHD